MTVASATLPSPGLQEIEHSARVANFIANEIERAGGWLAFDRYMHWVLYAPGLGYYAAGTRKFGTSGDFVTAPEISPLFAQALTAQLSQLFEELPPRILEFGAGSGVLARDLFAALSEHGVTLDRYSIVEVSADLTQRQRDTLHGYPVEWLDAPDAQFEGVMLANEVLDVMPVKLFVKRADVVYERGVVANKKGSAHRFAFEDRRAADDLASAVDSIEREYGRLPDGYTSEVGLIARGWMQSVGDWLERGVLLAIDYGFPQREYYHPQRLMGTMMCHFRHRAHGDPFWLPGLNDLTAHVDFSAMAQAAHDAQLDVLGYTSQARFLLNCGALATLDKMQSAQHVNAAHRLLSEAEMGELVKVLALGRGVDSALIGFAHGDRRHTL